MKRIILIAAAAAFAAAPALAKNAEHAVNKAAAPASVHYLSAMPNLWRTSEIKGMDVYSDQNEKIGSVDDVLLDQHGNVKAIVIGVGGFLGVGERDVAVPFNALHWQVNTTSAPNTTGAANGKQVAQATDHPARATLPGVTKEQLQKAPEFKYAS